MTLLEQKQHEAGLNELAFQSALRDMAEFYGRERLAQIVKAELAILGIKLNDSGEKS